MDEKQTALKTKAAKYFLLFLAAMLILTFVSRGIYAHQMPRVNVSTLQNTTLSRQVDCTGTAQTSRELPLTAVPELRIAEVCVKSGDVAIDRQVLLRYDTEYLESYIHRLTQQIEMDMLTRADYYKMEAWNTAKILTYTIEGNRKKLAEYQQLLDDGAVLRSDGRHMITDVFVRAGDFTGETACFMIADLSENLYFSGEITEEESKLISVGDPVSLQFRGGKILLQDCQITSIRKDAITGAYQVEIPLTAAEVTIGEIGQLNVTVTSSRTYDCIPLEAIHNNGEQSFVYVIEEREGFLGTEYHAAMRNIEIEEQNDTYAAVIHSGLSSEDKIVTFANKELYDGQTVRIE